MKLNFNLVTYVYTDLIGKEDDVCGRVSVLTIPKSSNMLI